MTHTCPICAGSGTRLDTTHTCPACQGSGVSPTVEERRAALAAPETWEPWDVIHDEATIRSLLSLCTYGPGLRQEVD